MSETKLGVLVLIGLPFAGAALLIALTSNSLLWTPLALVVIYLLFRRPRHRHRQPTTVPADELPMASDATATRRPVSEGENTL